MTASERRRRNRTSMTTRSSCFKPFDLVYEEITQRIRQFAVNLTNKDEVTWLNILIVAFRHESDKWDTNELIRCIPERSGTFTLEGSSTYSRGLPSMCRMICHAS